MFYLCRMSVILRLVTAISIRTRALQNSQGMRTTANDCGVEHAEGSLKAYRLWKQGTVVRQTGAKLADVHEQL